MRRTILAAALAAALTISAATTAPAAAAGRPNGRTAATTTSAAAPGEPVTAPGWAASAAATSTTMVKAIVVLRSQVDPSTVRAPSRRARQIAIVKALRAHAAAAQTGVLRLLGQRRAQGLVADVIPLWVQNAVSVVAEPSVLAELAVRPDVREIDPDRTLLAPAAVLSGTATAAPVEPNVEAVDAPAMWNLGLTGQGTVVATMDTGVDASHPDLAARWRGGTDSWYDPNGEHPTTPTDVNGHGTSTMGVIVGGTAGGTSIGVAPGAQWIAVKIFNDRGAASTTGIHQGFQWLLDPDGNPATADAPDVVNNSWSGASSGCLLDFQPDLRNLRAAGILPVFAAGNYGPSPSTVLSPANLPEALAVGGIDDAGVVDPSSSRGPSTCDGAISPQVVAPDIGIRTTDLYGGYLDANGTSLAAPHVTGALALLLGAIPEATPDRLQSALESTATDLGPAGAENSYGYGRIDALDAYNFLGSTPDFTITGTPSQATTTAGGTATYAVSVTAISGFAGDVSLTLAGLNTTQASWSIDPPVIPAGSGTAQVTITTSASLAPGTYPLTVTGTSGPLSRSLALSLVVNGPPDFGLAVTPVSRTVVAGSGTTYTASVSAINGFTGTVGLTLSGLPANVGTAKFTPSAVTAPGNATLSIATPTTAPPGTYPLTITGTSGTISHQAAITLVVKPRPDFTLSVSPASVTVLRRQTASYTVSTTATGGFTGTVALSVSGVPSGSSVSFTPNPVPVPGSSTLRITTTSLTPRGTFSLRITGTSGSLSHQATVTLIVQ